MSDRRVERTGMLVLRIWEAAEADPPMVARIRCTLDESREHEDVVTVHGADEIRATVLEWLVAMLDTERQREEREG